MFENNNIVKNKILIFANKIHENSSISLWNLNCIFSIRLHHRHFLPELTRRELFYIAIITSLNAHKKITNPLFECMHRAHCTAFVERIQIYYTMRIRTRIRIVLVKYKIYDRHSFHCTFKSQIQTTHIHISCIFQNIITYLPMLTKNSLKCKPIECGMECMCSKISFFCFFVFSFRHLHHYLSLLSSANTHTRTHI